MQVSGFDECKSVCPKHTMLLSIQFKLFHLIDVPFESAESSTVHRKKEAGAKK